MANLKISQLNAITNSATTDIIPVVDLATNTTKKTALIDLPLSNSATTALAGKANITGTDLITVTKTTSQLKLAYDANNYIHFTVNSDGSHTMTGLSAGNATKAVRSQTLSAATGDETAYAFNYTTNKAAGNDTGMRITMTDTASPGTSLLMELMTGATSLWKINQAGAVTHAGAYTITGNTISHSFAGGIFTGLSISDSAHYSLQIKRASSTGASNLVANNYVLGELQFVGFDGAGYQPLSSIKAIVDGTTGANDVPTRLVFYTSPDGSITPTEVLRINNAGFMTSAGGASLGGAANVNVLTAQPTGAVPLAIATTQYVDNKSKYGELSFYTSTGSAGTAVAIDTTLLYHALALASPVSGLLSGFTVIAGQSNAVASVAENSAGVSFKVTTTGDHNLNAGDIVTHTGFTTRTTYRGKFVVQSTPSGTEYIVLGTYLGTDTGFMKRGCGLKASSGSAGNYRLSYATSFTADANTTEFKIEVNKNITDNDNIACQRYFSSANQTGNLVSNGFITIADGDVVWLSCANLTDASDYKILHLNMNLNKV